MNARLLEKGLQIWEQFFALIALFRQGFDNMTYRKSLPNREVVVNNKLARYPMDGPVAYSKDFRKHLLRAVTESFDSVRFLGTDDSFGNLGSMRWMAPAIHAWSKHSRRVFHLTSELQILLQHTSLEGVMWSEVGFPFESFLINLTVPIRDDKGRAYGAILYAPVHNKTGGHEIHLLPNDIDGFNPMTPNEWRDLENLFRRGRYELYEKRLDRAVTNTIKTGGWPALKIYGGSDDSLISNVSYFPNQQCGKGRLDEDEITSIVDYAKNILVGLCLYLKTLPVGSPHQSEWKRDPNRKAMGDHRAISSEAEVCEVSCQFTLGNEEIRAIEDEIISRCTGREMPWHRRRGTWCRPKGCGHIVGYPRTVWRRPTWVRKDRMQEAQLSGGSTTVVK